MFAESFFLLRNLYFRNLIFQILLSYAMSLLGQHVTTYTKQWAFKPYQTYRKFYIVRPCCRRFGKLFLGTVIPAFFNRKVYVFWLNKYSFMNFNFPGNVAWSSVMTSWGYYLCISLSRWHFQFVVAPSFLEVLLKASLFYFMHIFLAFTHLLWTEKIATF